MLLGDLKRSSCGEGNVERLYCRFVFWYLRIRKAHPVYYIIPILQPTCGHSVCLLFEISKYFVDSRQKSVSDVHFNTIPPFLSPDLYVLGFPKAKK